MDSLKINSGVKRIMVNDDPNRVIEFDPTDITFAERFYSLIGEFETKLDEFSKQSAILEAATELDSHDIPVNIPDRLELLKEICKFIKDRIDFLFGAGTSEKAFESSLNLDMFTQFFEGVTPFIRTARSEKTKKYMKEVNDAILRKVMK